MTKKIVIWFVFLSILSIKCINAEEKFLSLKKNKTNVRYGPGLDYPIKYIYRKVNLPVKQIDKKENWRRVIFFIIYKYSFFFFLILLFESLNGVSLK